jgi:DNA-binding transcriptional regulator GbsR (MarR family)
MTEENEFEGPLFLTRPKSVEIYNFIVDSEVPVTVQEISTGLRWIYNTVKYHVKLMEDEGVIRRLKETGSGKSIYYVPVRKIKVVAKAKPNDKNLLRVFWPPAQKEMTFAEIIHFQQTTETPMGKMVDKIYDFIIKGHTLDIIRLADNPALIDDMELRKRFKYRANEIDKATRTVKDLNKLLTDLGTDKAKEIYHLDRGIRILIDEDTSFNPELIKELVEVKNSHWSTEQLTDMADKPISWIIGLFHATWNTPTIIDDISNVLPGIKKERLRHILATHTYADTGQKLFETTKEHRLTNYYMEPAEYWEYDSRNKAKIIAGSGLVETIFNIEPRNLDISPIEY